MRIGRRTLLKSSVIASLAAAMPLSSRMAFAASTNAPSSTVIFLLLRGGMDGLNLLAPSDDPNFVAVRSADLRPGTTGNNAGWALAGGPSNNDWRLNVNAPSFRDLYKSGHLAFIHAAGPSVLSRSHFQVQDLLERGISDRSIAASYAGWVGRYVAQGGVHPSSFSVVSTPSNAPLSCRSDPTAMNINSSSTFRLSSADKKSFIAAAYGAGTGPLATMAGATVSAVSQFSALNATYQQNASAGYAGDEFSRQLQTLAELIKTQAGLQIAEIEFDDWDHHVNEADRFPAHIGPLSRGLGAFWNDITAAGQANNVTVVAFSEFGRRVASNGSGGTDHGHGGVAFVLGGRVKGGRIYGKWPGLAPSSLIAGDLAVTTDYRAILLETLNATRGNLSPSFFPGLPAYTPLGFI